MAATRTYLRAWPPPRPAVDWLHALTHRRSPLQCPLECSGQSLVKSDKPVTATISSYKLLAARSVELYLNGRAVRITRPRRSGSERRNEPRAEVQAPPEPA